ncbi:M23 family metallopeptidase [Bacteroidales bacterium]
MVKEKAKRENKNRLRNKFRFSIFNDTTHEELFVFRANGLMMLLSIILSIIFIVISVTVLISYTPLREFIPGYPDARTRKEIVQNALKLDSLEKTVKLWDFQLSNIQRIVTGQPPLELGDITIKSDSANTQGISGKISKEDSLLRLEVMKQEQFNVGSPSNRVNQIEGLHFFPPVKGIVSDGFNLATNHPYIDIAAPANSVVSAVLDGTVIMATWTDETGFTIQIQHSNDLISIYKHNSKLLKRTGDKVKAGTAISLVGSTGTLTTGAHLHFELWYKGVAVDPAKYINF